MEAFTGSEIRDFRIRGNYINRRSLLASQALRFSGERTSAPERPGYSPPVVEFETEAHGATGRAVVREIDLPALCQADREKAIRHLLLILKAQKGDPEAVKELAWFVEQHPWAGAQSPLPVESKFVVPSTSVQPYSEKEISHKGSTLLKLSQMGYPVPDFVVLTTEAYADRTQNLEHHLAEAIQQLESLTLQNLGGAKHPLVVAVRCATAKYIPGVMDTYLNVGVTESTLPALVETYGAAVAHRMFLNNLKNLCDCLGCEDKGAMHTAVTSELPPEEVARLIDRLSNCVRRTNRSLVEDPFSQVTFFANQGYRQFDEDRELLLTLCRGTEHYPCVIMQKMVCTVRSPEAYAGVISSRNTKTGLGMEIQTAHNIFGEEIMTGTTDIQTTSFEYGESIKTKFPAAYHFIPHLPGLEMEFQSPVTIEFAVEATRRFQWFALLQLNETGMAGRAAVTAVVDMHKAGAISRKRVTELIRPYHIKQLTSDTIDQESFDTLNSFCSGVAVLPRSAVSARVFFSGDAALRAKGQGEKVCLCKKTFVPTDTIVMREMDAILSLTSAAIHVVTICQSLGIPAILSIEKHGASLQPSGLVNSSGTAIQEGDWITVSSRRRAVFEGKAQFKPARLLRYMRGEPVQFDDEEERNSFASLAYAYRYYQQLIKGLKVQQISTLDEITRLVNFELRGESEEARQLVNGWFDDREEVYMEGVLQSDIGDHQSQSNVFEMLTLDRKVRFFKRALAKCSAEHLSGYDAGAFMLGRFLSLHYPVAFWQCFTPPEIALLVNEWVLFEKYMQVLNKVGERKVLQTRKRILKDGLDDLYLHPGYVQSLITLKLSGAQLQDAKGSLPEWSDPQSTVVLELLQQPYRVFYKFDANWSVGQLEKICREDGRPLPGPDDV